LPSGYLYGVTGRRGSGKTALMITGSLAVIKGGKDGAAIIGYDVEQGRVAYITKENPADFRMKLAVNCYVHHIDRDLLNKNLLVLDGRTDSPAAICEALRIDAENNGPFQLVCYDTFQAGFAAAGAGDFNENAAVLTFLISLRPITEILGRPSGLIAFHPTKNATEEDLIPYGGGSIMNEIDGNLTLWSMAPYQIKLHQNRVRGPEFEPMHFVIEKLSCEDIIDKQGRQILLAVLRASTAEAVEERATVARNKNVGLLRAMLNDPDGTQRDWATASGLSKSTLNDRLVALQKERLVEKVKGAWRITEKGKKAC
jgi:hypothetical protein